MAPLFHRQPFKAIYLLGFLVTTSLRIPYWLIYYSWQPNRPRKSWTFRRTINVQILRKVAQLPLKLGVHDGRNLSLEVPQEELESLNARFVWVPELEKEDIVGMVAEHAARAGIKSIAIPAYWILKEGIKWSSVYDKAQKDEKVMLYFHGGAFVVCFFSPLYLASMPTIFPDGDRVSFSPNRIPCQRNTQIFHISLQSAVGRLSTHFSGTAEPIPDCSHRRNCSIQVPRLRCRIPTSEYHRGG